MSEKNRQQQARLGLPLSSGLNPKPNSSSLNPKPWTSLFSSKPYTLNPKLHIVKFSNPCSSPLNPIPWTLNSTQHC
jgi:hypothetical protein